jgi:hypothetical protein
MEKAIHIVEVFNHFENNKNINSLHFLSNHHSDQILLIQDLIYSVYFTFNQISNTISIYLINNLIFNNNELKEKKDYSSYTLSKKEFKFFLINLNIENFKDTIIDIIYHHFLNYDYNIFNIVNDWINNNLIYHHFIYHLLFIKINSLIPFSKK